MKLNVDLSTLLSSYEDVGLEFKRQISESCSFTPSEKKELAKDISAMANTLGGRIIIGYEKKESRLYGISSDIVSGISEYFDTIQRILKDRCYPPVSFHTSLEEYKGKKLIVIEIPQSQFPHQMKDTGAIYIRRGAVIDTAKPHEIAARYLQIQGSEIELPEEPIEKWPYEDRKIYLFKDKTAPFVKIAKTGPFEHVSNCVVFNPNFTVVGPPNFGNYWQSCRITIGAWGSRSSKDFIEFMTEVETIWMKLLGIALLDAYPSYWTISNNGFMIYGCGAENLREALSTSTYGAVASILQGCFGEHYDRTCFAVVYCQVHRSVISYLGMDTYLSCAPVNWNWINKLYSPFQHFGDFQGISNFSIYDIPMIQHISRQKTVKPEFLGGIERLGADPKEREYDQYTGVIMQLPDLEMIPYEISEVNPTEHPLKENLRVCPLRSFDSFVCSITNPPPLCTDIETGQMKELRTPRVTTMLFPAPGFSIYGITAHSTPIRDLQLSKIIGSGSS